MERMDRISIMASVAGGVVTHFLFNKYEPRRLFLIFSLILGPPAVLALSLYPSNRPSAVAKSYAIHLGSLLASLVAYRLSPYHPLAAFPGPVVAKLTRFHALYIVWTGNQHRYYKSLHARYGPYVRTGPNHIHVSEAAALSPVMATKPFRKGERYGVFTTGGSTGSLIGLVDPHEHAQRRKIWDRGLNTSAILGYEDMLFARIGRLTHQFDRLQGSEVDISLWLSCFSFDFMGDLAFGGAFRLSEQGSDADGHMRCIRLHMKFQEVLGAIPWVKPFVWMIPGSFASKRFRKFAATSVLARKAQGSSRKDIFYYLLDEEGIGRGPPSLPTLVLESALAIIAGSDTTGTALSNLFFYLLSNPEILARLQKEVDNAFPPGSDTFSPSVAAEMKLLNAVINETLRLQPAVPTGAQRLLPRGCGGMDIAGRWIPEGTTVQISAYSVHRDPQYFYPEPESFRPDRWLETKSDSRLDHSAYFPFSYGPTNCAGKGLALVELRMVVCALIQKFEFEFAPSFKTWSWDKNLEDRFILVKGELPVQIKTRNQ